MGSRATRGSGGITAKTGRYKNADGESVEYTYWQASREVPAEHLPHGMTRKRITGNGRTKAEAFARLATNYDAFIAGTPKRGSVRRSGRATLRTLFEDWDRNNNSGAVSPVQARAYRGYFNNHILPALGDRRLDSLTETELNYFFTTVLPGKTDDDGERLLGGNACRNIYMALSGAFTYGVRNRYLTESPLRAVKAPKRGKVNDDINAFVQDAQKVHAEILRGDHPDETRWLLALLGLRRSERLGVGWDTIKDLDTDSPTLEVARQLTRQTGKGLVFTAPKNDSSRTIALVEPWVSSLRRYREKWNALPFGEEWKTPDEKYAQLLFLQPNGRPIDHNDDNDDWHALLESVGVRYWRGHLMRHYTAVMLAEQPGLSVTDVMSILGHDTAALTLYYSHAERGRHTDALRAYGEAVAGRRPQPARAR